MEWIRNTELSTRDGIRSFMVKRQLWHLESNIVRIAENYWRSKYECAREDFGRDGE